MFNGYYDVLGGIALKQVKRQADIPDVRLAVGVSEDLAGKPILIPNKADKHMINPTYESVNMMSYEKAKPNFEGLSLSENDFPSDGFYIGDGIGGVF